MVEGAPAYYTRSIYYNTISLLINGLRSICRQLPDRDFPHREV